MKKPRAMPTNSGISDYPGRSRPQNGKKSAHSGNKLRLLHIPERVRREISVDVITERHVRSLLKLKEEELQLEALNRIYKNNLNVRQTYDLVETMLIREEKSIREQKKKR